MPRSDPLPSDSAAGGSSSSKCPSSSALLLLAAASYLSLPLLPPLLVLVVLLLLLLLLLPLLLPPLPLPPDTAFTTPLPPSTSAMIWRAAPSPFTARSGVAAMLIAVAVAGACCSEIETGAASGSTEFDGGDCGWG